MFRVTSLAQVPDEQLNRWIKRLGLLLVVGTLAFVGFYAFDRFRLPGASMVDRQVTAAEEQVRQAPDDINTRLRLGTLYLGAKRWDDAVSQFDQVLAISDGNRIAILGKGHALYEKGDLDQAAATYQVLVDQTRGQEFSPVDTQLEEARYYLGAISLQKNDAQGAVDNFTAALEINKSDADALYGLGKAYVAAQQPQQAIDPLRRAVVFVPVGWADPYLALRDAFTALNRTTDAGWAAAMAVAASGDKEAARSQLEALAASDPTTDVFTCVGLVAETQGDLGAAAAAYQRALELDPGNAGAAEGLGRVRHDGSEASSPPLPPASSPLPSGTTAGDQS
jgi:tetratricopeptide (TPR) repeat protein